MESNTNTQQRLVSRLGLGSAVLTAIMAATALGIAVTTAPARSGPYCMTADCVTYPYTDAAAFVPNDYLWMYPALLMSLLFWVLVICIHHRVAAEKQVFSQIGLGFAAFSAAVLATNYFIQITVVQPSLLRGEVEGLSLFSQYNPHGIFIALEDVGYLAMGAAFLFVAAGLGRQGRLERMVRVLFAAAGILAVGAFPVLALVYGSQLEYRYEVISLLVDWITLIFSGVLLGLFFGRSSGR